MHCGEMMRGRAVVGLLVRLALTAAVSLCLYVACRSVLADRVLPGPEDPVLEMRWEPSEGWLWIMWDSTPTRFRLISFRSTNDIEPAKEKIISIRIKFRVTFTLILEREKLLSLFNLRQYTQ